MGEGLFLRDEALASSSSIKNKQKKITYNKQTNKNSRLSHSVYPLCFSFSMVSNCAAANPRSRNDVTGRIRDSEADNLTVN